MEKLCHGYGRVRTRSLACQLKQDKSSTIVTHSTDGPVLAENSLHNKRTMRRPRTFNLLTTGKKPVKAWTGHTLYVYTYVHVDNIYDDHV